MSVNSAHRTEAIHRAEAIGSSDERREGGAEDLAWVRFRSGIVVVVTFLLIAMLLVIAIGGARAGANYGLGLLIVTLAAGTIDGLALARRRRHR